MKNDITYDSQGNARSFTGPRGVAVYQMAVLASALRLYAKTGMKANRAYTPKNMMRTAEALLGRKFAARDYIGAAEALSEKVKTEKAQIAQL